MQVLRLQVGLSDRCIQGLDSRRVASGVDHQVCAFRVGAFRWLASTYDGVMAVSGLLILWTEPTNALLATSNAEAAMRQLEQHATGAPSTSLRPFLHVFHNTSKL